MNLKTPPSPEAIAYRQWISSLGDTERRLATALGVDKFLRDDTLGTTVETWQADLTVSSGDSEHFDLRLDLLDSGVPSDRLNEVVETFEMHAEPLAFHFARKALHEVIRPLLQSDSPKIHGFVHALDLTLMSLEDSAKVCNCSKQAIHKHSEHWRKRLTAPPL